MSDRYNIIEKIGEGNTSQVHKISDKKNGKIYAFKIIKKRPDRDEIIRNEISIQSDLNNPNIVKIIESLDDDTHFYIVMELCGNNLYEYLKKVKYIEESDAILIFKQIVNAVKYLHDNNIYHRDIKLENVVKCGSIWKLIDFGFATKDEYTYSIVGTLDYHAPELVSSKRSKSNLIDVWTLGILLYELLYGKPPFMRRTYKETYNAIRYDPVDYSGRELSPKIRNLIDRILTKDLNDRIDINELNNFLM